MSQTVNIPAKEYFFISVKELEDVIKQKDFILINTHTPFDGDIPFTDTSIIFDKIEENLDLLPRDKNIKLVIYCRSGHMSAIASQKLADLGYTNVYDLIGGMKAWVNAGNKLIKG